MDLIKNTEKIIKRKAVHARLRKMLLSNMSRRKEYYSSKEQDKKEEPL